MIIRAQTLASSYLQVDETPVRYLVPGTHLRQGYGGRDGRFEIDNNLVENAVRPLKLGAKNPPSPRLRRTGWLFFGSEHAGHNAAVIYTLVENCRRHDIPVEGYLRELLTRLPGEKDPEIIASFTPARLAAARPKKSAAA